MKYYKKQGQVFAFEADGSQDTLISDDMLLMTPVQVDEYLEANTPPIKQTLPPLTRRQFKLALLHASLNSQIEQAINAIPDAKTKAVIEIEYNESTEFVRTSDSVVYMCNLLSLTDDDVDSIWESALSL